MVFLPVSGSPVCCANERRRTGSNDTQAVDVVGKQLQVEADLRDVLRLVDD